MWGWQVALYLFFGGLSAGSFVFAAVLQLAHGMRYQRTVCIVTVCSLVFLAVGAVLLLIDVGLPLRAMDVAHSFRNVGASWMARGAWILMGCAGAFALYALAAMLPFGRFSLLGRRRETILNAMGIAGIACSFLLAGYTGMLLTDAEGIRAWSTALIPALFTVSALDTGVAFGLLVFRVAEQGREMRPGRDMWLGREMRRIVAYRFDAVLLALVCMEAIVLAVYSMWLGSGWGLGVAGAASLSFEAGSLASLPVVFGLLLCAAAFGAVRFLAPAGKGVLSTASSLLSIGAGITLRFAVLALGVHTAFLW